MSEATTPAPLPAWKKVVFSLVMLGFMAVALEVVAQIYLRMARGYDGGGEFLQYQFDPYKNIQLTPNWRDTRGVTHNAQGFREVEDVAREAAPGTLRIFLMGASTAYGLGGMFPHIQTEYAVLDNSETIDAYLEEILESANLPYERVEVINAAIPSIWTHHHLIYLNQMILGYDPDMVLFLDGWNDHFFMERWRDQFASYVQTEQASVIMGPATLGSLVRMNAWWWFRKSAAVHVAARVARNVKTVLTGQDAPAPIDVPKAIEDLNWVFEHNALQMIERNAVLLQHEEIPSVFMLQPMLILEREHLARMPEIERELFEFNAGWQEGFEEYMRLATPIVSRRVEETVTQLGHRYIDMTRLYAESDGQIFTDYAHLTPEGNRLLAERLAAEILDLLGTAGSAPH